MSRGSFHPGLEFVRLMLFACSPIPIPDLRTALRCVPRLCAWGKLQVKEKSVKALKGHKDSAYA